MITAKQYVRYERQVELCGVGKPGQSKLLNARVLMVGAGGLGCPAGLYLAAAGIGHITIVDNDIINISNIHRQILYDENQLKKSKVDIFKAQLEKLNPDCKITALTERINSENASGIIAAHDIIIDGSDNFKTRYLLNEVCHMAQKTLVSGAILQFDGQVYVFRTHEGGPCYRCLFPHEPTNAEVPSCTESAVLGSVAGVIGTLMATEVIKEIVEVGKSLDGNFLLFSSLNSTMKKIYFEKRKNCQTCGKN